MPGLWGFRTPTGYDSELTPGFGARRVSCCCRSTTRGNGLFNAPNMAMLMTHTPRPLLATAGASASLTRTMGFAMGPAPATLAWSSAAYRLDGMRSAVTLAMVLSALSVVALVRMRVPGERAVVVAGFALDGCG